MISIERIKELYVVAIEMYGGIKTLTDDQIEKAKGKIAQAEAGAYYSGMQGDHLHVAAFALKYFAQDQVFTDGNKRVAWMVAVDILQLIDIGVNATPEEAADFVLRVANEKLSYEDILAWLAFPGRLFDIESS